MLKNKSSKIVKQELSDGKNLRGLSTNRERKRNLEGLVWPAINAINAGSVE